MSTNTSNQNNQASNPFFHGVRQDVVEKAEKLVVASQGISIPSTEAVMPVEELEALGIKLNHDLFKGMKKSIIPAGSFKDLETFRSKVNRFLREEGFPSAGVTLLTLDKADVFRKLMEEGEEMFNDFVGHFMAKYPQMIKDYLAAQPAEDRVLIERAVLSPAQLESRFDFDWAMAPLGVVAGMSPEKLEERVESLADKLMKKLAGQAGEVLKNRFGSGHVPGEVGEGVVKDLQKMEETLKSLGFVSDSADGILVELQDVLAGLPATPKITNKISGGQYHQIKALLLIMSNSGYLKQFGGSTGNTLNSNPWFTPSGMQKAQAAAVGQATIDLDEEDEDDAAFDAVDSTSDTDEEVVGVEAEEEVAQATESEVEAEEAPAEETIEEVLEAVEVEEVVEEETAPAPAPQPTPVSSAWF